MRIDKPYVNHLMAIQYLIDNPLIFSEGLIFTMQE